MGGADDGFNARRVLRPGVITATWIEAGTELWRRITENLSPSAATKQQYKPSLLLAATPRATGAVLFL
jgi:hypothetical protein